jgi:hypothetical protein
MYTVVFLLTGPAFLTWSRMAMRSLRVQRKSQLIGFRVIELGSLCSTTDGAGGECLICRLVPAQACLTNTPPERRGTFTLTKVSLCSLAISPSCPDICIQKTNVCSTQTSSNDMRILSSKRKGVEPSSSSAPISNQMMHDEM